MSNFLKIRRILDENSRATIELTSPSNLNYCRRAIQEKKTAVDIDIVYSVKRIPK